MKLERLALVTMPEAIPWAPIVHGLDRGLQANRIATIAAGASPPWLFAEVAARFEPQAVLFALHAQMAPHVAAWRATMPAGVPFVALCFDDPYDMATPLRLFEHFDLMLTPEPCAIDDYTKAGRRADVLLPTVCNVWHRPPAEPVAQACHVLSIAGRSWTPRKVFVPMLVKALEARGFSFGEVAGNRRWIVGRELTAALHSCAMTFDLPRCEYTTDNPRGVPCTYVGPRVHVAAACGTPCLLIDPRGDAKLTYPDALTAPLHEGIEATLALLGDAPRRQRAAELCRERFLLAHRPDVRGAELAAMLRRHLDLE